MNATAVRAKAAPMTGLEKLDAVVEAVEKAIAILISSQADFPTKGHDITRAVVDVELADLRRSRNHLHAAADAVRRETMTEAERRRFDDGRRDWREEEWQDHCGDPNCEQCEGAVIPWTQL